MRGKSLVGISAANRKASGIAAGDEVEVSIELDAEPRVVTEPVDVAAALDVRKDLRAAFDRLPFGLKRKHLRDIEESKSAETRQRRIAKLVNGLEEG